jgi:ribosome-binding protein aMBF1 (putative translation factor)
MTIYKVCEICDLVINTIEVEGEGLAEIKGVCEDCAEEIGTNHRTASITNNFWYN